MCQLWTVAALALAVAPVLSYDFELGGARLTIDERGWATSLQAGERQLLAPLPFCQLRTGAGWRTPLSARAADGRLDFDFGDGVGLSYTLSSGPGWLLGRVVEVRGLAAGELVGLRSAFLDTVGLSRLGPSIAAAYDDHWAVGLMPTSLNQQPHTTGTEQGHRLWIESEVRFEVQPAGFVLLACPRADLATTIAAAEQAAGLPSPRPGGQWGKTSVASKRSYLFIFSNSEGDTDELIGWAKQGGFGTVLMGEHWSQSHGHHEINRQYFPDGLPSLQRTAQRLHQAGLNVGLHLLAAAVYARDPYVTPVPDRRLVVDARSTLAEPLDEVGETIALAGPPTGFPTSDGGYMGNGLTVRIDDELISYSAVQAEPPYALTGCRRGAEGTKVAAHAAGAEVNHLMRSYGYYLFDLRTSLADEVIGRVADVANAIDADMIYFDGSERLQEEHWWANAKLHDTYYRKLNNKNVFLQASSWTPWSWHLLSRTASADGHGDVKGYLDERTPGFAWYAANLMPLDCGWYYMHDHEVTADQFDYILQRCLGFDCSISLQTTPDELRKHPEAATILDLCNVYERLRLSGLVGEETRAKLREPGREYRLLREPLALVRTHYGPWQPWVAGQTPAEVVSPPVEPAVEGARLGFQLRCLATAGQGPAAKSAAARDIEPLTSLAPYLGREAASGTAMGTTNEDVSHELALDGQTPDGQPAVRYTGTSARTDSDGWSVVSRGLEPAVDLSATPALGFWMKGDGGGAQFKVQLRDGVGALDWYIPNDFVGWRWIQLELDKGIVFATVDRAKISSLSYYYNGLPATKSVSVWFGPLRALPALDSGQIVNPTLTVGGRTVRLEATVGLGERLVWFPGEAPYVVPAEAGPRRPVAPAPDLELTAATPVSLSADPASIGSGEWRLVQQGSEQLALPPEALATVLPALR